MDYPGMSGYRHPQDGQSIPPPPHSMTPQNVSREQGMPGNPMFPRPTGMPPGYPPSIGDPIHAAFSIVPHQDQAMAMNYQGPTGHMQSPGMPPNFNPQAVGNPMMQRPPQPHPHFRPGTNLSHNMPPQSFHAQQQLPPPPPHSQPQQQRTFPNPGGGSIDYQQLHSQSHQASSHPPRHHPNPMVNEFHMPNHGGVPEFHPNQQAEPPHPPQTHQGIMAGAPDFHPTQLQTSSLPAEFHPHQRPTQEMSRHEQVLPQQDFRLNNRGQEQQQMAMGGYMDHNNMGMMGDPNMMGGLENHMLAGGDAYSQHHLLNMYDHPQMPELREGDYMPIASQLMDKTMQSTITCVNFDVHQELLWAGNQRGYVASYYGTEFQKYSAFRVNTEEDVRQNLSFPQGILSLSPSLLRGTIRRGIPVFHFKDPDFHDMQCMMMRDPNSVLIGGHHKHVLEIDIIQNCLRNKFEVKDAGVAIFRSTDRFICGGDSTGKVTVYDGNSMRPEHTLEAHTSCLSDFDILGNLLITCGFSSRMNALTPDRVLMVYDLRVMRAMAPIPLSFDPTFLRFLPHIPQSLVVVSQTGNFQIVETISGGAPSNPVAFPVNTNGSAVVAFDVSSTYQSFCFGDSSGHVHLFSTDLNSTFNGFSEPTEFADPIEHLDPIDVNDELAAYSQIPMPYPAQGPLVSDFPEEMMNRVYRKSLPIDQEVLRNMKMYQNIGYAPNTNKLKRNVIPYEMNENKSKDKNSVPESPIGRGDDPFMTVPKRYRRVEIKYSKLGVEDFDFRHYNKTNLAGLEPHIPNAYCNSMLQVLYFIEPLRCALLSHVCSREFCLSCELGFLFHMLDSQKGNTCQATNFLRAFRTMPQVSPLGLVLHDVDENSGRVDFPRLIQSWQRFVLMQTHQELSVDPITEAKKQAEMMGDDRARAQAVPESNGEEQPKAENAESNGDNSESVSEPQEEPHNENQRSIITDLLGINIKSSLQCKCGLTSDRNVDGTHINLMYPDFRPAGGVASPIIPVSFGEVVQHSMTATTNIQAWCSACNRYQHHCQRKSIQNLPDVLALNCHTENEKNLDFWKAQFQIVRAHHQEFDPPATVIRPSQSAIRCRFGNACHRQDCRFQHDGPRECDNQPKKNQPPAEDDEFGPSWIPMGLKIVRSPDGNVFVTEISDEEPLPSQQEPDTVYYELYSVVSHVLDSNGGNLVCCLKVSEPYHQRKEKVTCTQWYLINDFCITPVEKDEAVDFKLNWNVPCIIHYNRRNFLSSHDLKVKSWSSPEVLFNDMALLNPERRKITFLPLQPEELPKEGDLVALDAEFVSLKEEEAELRSDGTRSTILPSQMSVARITCIRGSGPNMGEAFLDDYICTHENVVDYLTQFSGIKQGDLDKGTSSKHLTTLKSTYLKLRYLVDSGITFVGHGLKKDFRVINLLVPKAQVMDTVDLYHLHRQRFISLKFLAWYFLKINIQSYTHDSAEDARTALQLYLKYQSLKDVDKDKVLRTIHELYEEGRKISWKIPDVAGEELSEADFL